METGTAEAAMEQEDAASKQRKYLLHYGRRTRLVGTDERLSWIYDFSFLELSAPYLDHLVLYPRRICGKRLPRIIIILFIIIIFSRTSFTESTRSFVCTKSDGGQPCSFILFWRVCIFGLDLLSVSLVSRFGKQWEIPLRSLMESKDEGAYRAALWTSNKERGVCFGVTAQTEHLFPCLILLLIPSPRSLLSAIG